MTKELSGSLKRLGRNGAALLIAGAASYFQARPEILIAAPLLNAAAKYARERWGIKWLII